MLQTQPNNLFNAHKWPDNGSQLEPKHVAVNKLIIIAVVCDWIDTDACGFLTPTGVFHLNLNNILILALLYYLFIYLYFLTYLWQNISASHTRTVTGDKKKNFKAPEIRDQVKSRKTSLRTGYLQNTCCHLRIAQHVIRIMYNLCTRGTTSVYKYALKFGLTQFGNILPLSYKMKFKVSRDEMSFTLIKSHKILGAI